MRRAAWISLGVTALAVVGIALLEFSELKAAPKPTPPQASLVLKNSDVALCHHNDTEWTLTKSADVTDAVTGDTIIWTVDAVRGATSNNILQVNGFVSITNSAAGNATIGNIVVNLQTKVGTKWVSKSVDVANAAFGDAATSAKIVAAASQEATNLPIYSISGATGTFTENAASGSLEFTDQDSNTVWAISPQQTIPANQTVNLLFTANFNNSLLAIAPGTQVRAEVIVTFGNAGARGGSGSSATNIDINGNGSIDADEANVRSVPTRITRNVPALEQCNNELLLTDELSTTGTVSYVEDSNDIGDGLVISASGTYTIETTVDSGADGGTISNTAYLDGQDSFVSVIIGYDNTDPLNPVPIYFDFPCCIGLHLQASASVNVEGDDDLQNGDYCSFSQGGYGGSGAPFNLLNANFATVFPSGVEVGIPGAGGFSMKFTSAAAVQAFLPQGGTANPLTADLTNPTSSAAGQFGGQVLALKLNVALSDAGATNAGFGDLYYCDPASSLDGFTVRQILAAAETAIGGGALPAGYTYASLAGLCANLDLSFDGKDADAGFPTCGVVSAWALQFLSKSPCP